MNWIDILSCKCECVYSNTFNLYIIFNVECCPRMVIIPHHMNDFGDVHACRFCLILLHERDWKSGKIPFWIYWFRMSYFKFQLKWKTIPCFYVSANQITRAKIKRTTKHTPKVTIDMVMEFFLRVLTTTWQAVFK